MKIEPEKAKAILEAMIASGAIEEDAVEEVAQQVDSGSIKDFADFIHSIFCYSEHASGQCTYYEEQGCYEVNGTEWNQPAHAEWLTRAKEMLDRLHIGNIEMAVAQLQYILKEYENPDNHEGAKLFIEYILYRNK